MEAVAQAYDTGLLMQGPALSCTNIRSHLLSAQVVTKPQVTPSPQAKQSGDLGGGTEGLGLAFRMGTGRSLILAHPGS